MTSAPPPAARPLRILCVGEAMVELRLAPDARHAAVGFAGDMLNTAIYLRRALPAPHAVGFVSVLGRDALSERMVGFIAAEGVATDRIARHPTRLPGLYAIETRADGERSFSYWRERSAARTLFEDGDLSALDGADVVVHSAITLAILAPEARAAFLRRLTGLRAAGGLVAFDGNWRPPLWPDAATARAAVEPAWRACDIALPSADDEAALFGDRSEAETLARLRGWGAARGALKRGAAGPLAIDPHAGPSGPFAPAERVADTTAAGDAFNGAYLAAVLTGATEGEALAAGHALAARVVGWPGAILPRA